MRKINTLEMKKAVHSMLAMLERIKKGTAVAAIALSGCAESRTPGFVETAELSMDAGEDSPETSGESSSLDAVCQITSCADLGAECGPVVVGCGLTINCGFCPTDAGERQVCNAGHCATAAPDAAK